MLRLAENIVHQMQPTSCSCTATCMAMALGIPVADMGIDLEQAYDFLEAGLWLAERGIWLRIGIFNGGRGESFHDGAIYLVGIRSQNIIASDHTVLLDTRGHRTSGTDDDGHKWSRSGWKFYDPNLGRAGKSWVEWVDPSGVLDFCQLHQHDVRYQRMGSPP